jgi:hypothetical protein
MSVPDTPKEIQTRMDEIYKQLENLDKEMDYYFSLKQPYPDSLRQQIKTLHAEYCRLAEHQAHDGKTK